MHFIFCAVALLTTFFWNMSVTANTTQTIPTDLASNIASALSFWSTPLSGHTGSISPGSKGITAFDTPIPKIDESASATPTSPSESATDFDTPIPTIIKSDASTSITTPTDSSNSIITTSTTPITPAEASGFWTGSDPFPVVVPSDWSTSTSTSSSDSSATTSTEPGDGDGLPSSSLTKVSITDATDSGTTTPTPVLSTTISTYVSWVTASESASSSASVSQPSVTSSSEGNRCSYKIQEWLVGTLAFGVLLGAFL